MSTELIKVTINGQESEVEKGSRLIDVCRDKGFGIPSFCYYPGLSLQGACRMCLCEIERMPKLQTACTTPAADGMVIEAKLDRGRGAAVGGGQRVRGARHDGELLLEAAQAGIEFGGLRALHGFDLEIRRGDLTPEQFRVTQKNGTEYPGTGALLLTGNNTFTGNSAITMGGVAAGTFSPNQSADSSPAMPVAIGLIVPSGETIGG